MVISYSSNIKPEPHQLVELFKNSGLYRPLDDFARIKKMIDNCNLIITAWDSSKLVGIIRGSSDFSYFCYLSDIAVDKDYLNYDIGHIMMEKLDELVSSECSVIYISPGNNDEFLLESGFEQISDTYIIRRKK